MDYWNRTKNTKLLADRITRKRLNNHNYSEGVLKAFDLIQKPPSESKNITIELALMDIAWRISGNYPSEKQLAKAFFPIQGFFLGTVYQDQMLDSLHPTSTRPLVEKLGIPTCMIMGNILYCESLLSLLEVDRNEGKKIPQLLNSLEKLIHNVMDTEIYRRSYIGKILPLEGFFRIWRILTPYTACIEIGGTLGNSEEDQIQILTEIGSNISIIYRIHKEVSEIYGLRGSLQEKLRTKPPPLPVTLGYESANPSEKQALEKIIKNLSLTDEKGRKTKNSIKDIERLIDIVVRYNSISTALKIHRDIFMDSRKLIAKLSNSKHKDILNILLGPNILSQNVSEKELFQR